MEILDCMWLWLQRVCQQLPWQENKLIDVFFAQQKKQQCDNLSLCIDTNYLKLFNDYDPAKVEMYMTLCQAKDLKFGVILDL